MSFSYTLLLTKETTFDFGNLMIAEGEYELIHCRDIANTLIIDNHYFNSDVETYDFANLLAFLQEDKEIAVIINYLDKHMFLSDALTKLGIKIIESYEASVDKIYLGKSHSLIKEIDLVRTKSSNMITTWMKAVTNKHIIKKNKRNRKRRWKQFVKIRNMPKKYKKVKEKEQKVIITDGDW